MKRRFGLLLLLSCLGGAQTPAEDAFEQSPISYSAAIPQDAISALKLKLTSGQLRLEGDEKQVVRGLLAALGVPEASQMLVFSKTSFQKDRIDPAHPRAIYFSDQVYVGWCPGGLVEIAAIDPILGPIFYSVDPHAGRDPLRFQRDADCLRCHGGTFIRDIPALLVRSVFTDSAGQLMLSLGSELVDSTTPLEKRWGGWFVTARRAGPRHRGNLVLTSEQEPGSKELAAHASLATLDKLVDTRPYLKPSSDVTALLVFEHQVCVQNALTKANQQCLRMIDYQKRLQKELKEPVTDEPTYESVRHVFASASQEVLDALLSKDEAALPQGGIQGVGGFANAFNPTGTTSSSQPSLRQLDLEQRLFRYRCSYLIQSTTFERLQPTLRRRVLQRLWHVLTDPVAEPRYAYLESAERDMIRQILTATLPHLPPIWRDT
jgi:hypothetical protein